MSGCIIPQKSKDKINIILTFHQKTCTETVTRAVTILNSSLRGHHLIDSGLRKCPKRLENLNEFLHGPPAFLRGASSFISTVNWLITLAK